jgi:Group II intron, maturase-specific domain
LHLRTWHTIGSLAREINPVVRGWMQYYGAFYRSALLAPPAAHQRLPDALAPQEIQAAGICEEGQGLLEARHRPVSPAVRPLGVGALFLVVRMTGAG